MMRGEARDDRETFEFTIEPFVTGGFVLRNRFSGDGRENTTGGGFWPTIEKAKQVAQETATKLLHGAVISWEENSE